MRLKTLSKIDLVINRTFIVLVSPFSLVKGLVELIIGKLIIDSLVELDRWISNKLLLMSDEVKDGTICNKDALCFGAHSVYKMWEAEQKENKDNDE